MSKWISVEDRLPDIAHPSVYSDVVLVVHCGDVTTAIYVKAKSGKVWWRMSHLDERLHHVTHWMPLPEPPQPEQKEV